MPSASRCTAYAYIRLQINLDPTSMPAIYIENSSNVSFDNVGISGFDVGIEAKNSRDISIRNGSFSNVRTAIKARNVDGLNAKNNVHSEHLAPAPAMIRSLPFPAVWRRFELNSYAYHCIYGESTHANV